MAALCLWIALRWLRLPALRQPLVAMLFGAFLLWDVALWLGAAARLTALDMRTAAALDLAAIHAPGIGYLGGMLLVIAARLSSTHGGRPLAIDRTARGLYALLQLAVALRLVAALAPAASPRWLPWAALAWLGVAGVWAAQHGRWPRAPRADVRPG